MSNWGDCYLADIPCENCGICPDKEKENEDAIIDSVSGDKIIPGNFDQRNGDNEDLSGPVCA